MATLRYLRYIILHKWYVYHYGRQWGIGRWQLLTHDLSKFLPSEFFAYRNSFYGGERTPAVRREFDLAWLRHQHRNPHHWQYWILRYDDGNTIPVAMPYHFLLEMIADWQGAGAIRGKGSLPQVREWYEDRYLRVFLHEATRRWLEQLLGMAEKHGVIIPQDGNTKEGDDNHE